MLTIEQRCLDYAVRAIKLYRFLEEKQDSVSLIIGKQYLRSSTSIGANVAEAQSAESRADFIHKLAVAQKEARESLYWLKLLINAEVVSPKRLNALMQETDEIIAILSTIIINTKKRKNSS